MRPSLVPALVLATALSSPGCERERRDVTKVYPAPRLAALARSDTGPVRYEATSSGTAEFVLADAGRRVEGAVPVARGWLRVDLADLRSLEGKLRFDVSRLTVRDNQVNVRTDAIRSALDVSESAASTRTAMFSITEVKSATQLHAKGRETDEGVVDVGLVRTANVVVRGDLELHGFRSERELELELSFELDPNLADAPPRRVAVDTVRPWRLPLAPFGIPRTALGEGFGKLLDTTQVTLHAEFMPTH
jgi:hypothetical protein